MIIREIREDDYLNFHKINENLQVFHRIGWLNAISSVYPVQWKLLGGFNDRETLVVAFPVYLRKVFGILLLAGSPLPQLGTPIPTVVTRDNTISIKELMDAIRVWLKKERIFYFQMTVHTGMSCGLSELNGEYEVIDNLELPIEQPIEELWAQIKKKRKSLIRGAIKSGIKVHWFYRENSIREYQKLLESTYDKSQKLKPNFGENLYTAIYRNLRDNGLRLIGATYGGSVVSILWILYDQQKCYFWDGASDQITLREIDVNRLLHWEVIRWAKRKGLKVYDLVGRTEKSGRAGLRPGIAKFKKTLGGQRVDYIKIVMAPIWLKMSLAIYRKVFAFKNRPKFSGKEVNDE